MNPIEQYKQMLITALISCGVIEEEAERRYSESALPDMMRVDLAFVGHYPPEYWIDNDFI